MGGRVAILVVLAVLVGYLGWRRHTWLPLVRVLIALGLLTVVVYGIKHGTGRTAPGFPGAYFFHADGESFPFGHVANAVLMWGSPAGRRWSTGCRCACNARSGR